MDILQLTVTNIRPAATNAIIVFLKEINDRPIPYEAGQFFTFIINHYGKEVRRSYSIASTPGVDDQIAIVIKRRVNGEISRYLIDHLKTGDVLSALPPSGRFLLKGNLKDQTLVFIAAGSGITPVYSLLKKLLYFEGSAKAVLICQNHDEQTVIFRDELRQLQEKFPSKFVWISLLSNPGKNQLFPRRLNNTFLEQLINTYVPATAPVAFYLCGPLAFMRMAQFVIKLMGFQDEQITKETFVIDTIPPPPVISDSSPKNVKLRWKDQHYQFTSAYPSSILQAALNNNIQLPYSCRGGRCSTCTVRCISGKVKMSINEVLTDKDLKEGLVLTCVGYAETDVEIEI